MPAEIIKTITEDLRRLADTAYENGYDDGWAKRDEELFDELKEMIKPAIEDACSHCPDATNYHPLSNFDCCDWKAMSGKCGFAKLITFIFEEE